MDPELAEPTRRLREAAPELVRDLCSCRDAAAARRCFDDWLAARRRHFHDEIARLHPLDEALARRSLEVLDGITALRNERRLGESTLAWLWRFLREDPSALQSVRPGFLWEFVHLVEGATGRGDVARGWMRNALPPPNFAALRGREGALARSDFLDTMGEEVWRRIESYPCGLDLELAEQRAENRRRILAALDASEEDWSDHHWQLRNIFAGATALPRLEPIVALSKSERESIRLAVEHRIPFGITPHYLSLFDLDDADGRRDTQVRAQVIPPPHYVRRMIEHRGDRRHHFDFMGEYDTSPLELVTRRYPTVAILKALDTCPQICVYCQRNWELEGPMLPGGFPPTQTIDAALDWFAEHKTVRDILVTGGDPLFHNTKVIARIMERIAAMDHVLHVRWGSRAPVSMPMQITERLADTLARFVEPGRRTLSVVTHVESPLEVTPEMAQVVHRLRARAIPVYNQQVYTVFTSRRFQTAALRVALKRVGIDPYYTFYPKGKEETRDYIVPLARVLQETKEEARLLPGIFRTDEAVFNVPRLGKNHVRASQDRELIGIRPDGRRVYLWHPWEKGIAPTEPWQYEDASIHDYLRRLEALGEDPAEYDSIWHYY